MTAQSVGMQQGLAMGNLRAGFQAAVTVLLGGGVLFSLLLLRAVPADMAALRGYVACRIGDISAVTRRWCRC